MIQNILNEEQKSLQTALAFRTKYGEALGKDASAFLCSSGCMLCDAALAGDVLGKHSWRRHLNYDGRVSWIREIDGVKVTIENAEDLQINDSPVPENAFPLQLWDTEDSEEISF